MRKSSLFVVGLLLTFAATRAVAQIPQKSLLSKPNITTRDYLELWLNIYSNLLTTGAFAPSDMGKVGCPVTLRIDAENRIHFDLYEDYDTAITRAQNAKFTKLSISIVIAAVEGMFASHFPQIRFNARKDFVGSWYSANGLVQQARWRSGGLHWVVIPVRENGRIILKNLENENPGKKP